MAPSLAQSTASGSVPRSCASVSMAFMSVVSTPRRRCVDATPTPVTWAAGMTPPGTLRSRVRMRPEPTMRPASVISWVRPGSKIIRLWSAVSSSTSSRNALAMWASNSA